MSSGYTIGCLSFTQWIILLSVLLAVSLSDILVVEVNKLTHFVSYSKVFSSRSLLGHVMFWFTGTGQEALYAQVFGNCWLGSSQSEFKCIYVNMNIGSNNTFLIIVIVVVIIICTCWMTCRLYDTFQSTYYMEGDTGHRVFDTQFGELHVHFS